VGGGGDVGRDEWDATREDVIFIRANEMMRERMDD